MFMGQRWEVMANTILIRFRSVRKLRIVPIESGAPYRIALQQLRGPRDFLNHEDAKSAKVLLFSQQFVADWSGAKKKFLASFASWRLNLVAAGGGAMLSRREP